MWYLTWFLGTLLACGIAVIAGLAFEHNEANKAKKDEA